MGERTEKDRPRHHLTIHRLRYNPKEYYRELVLRHDMGPE